MRLSAALLLIPLLASAGYKPLFTGVDLAGWAHEGPRPSFSVSQGELRCSGTAFPPNWLHTAGEYEDFRLRFEYKLAQWAEASVMVRAARSERPEHTGLTLVLAHDYHNETTAWTSGALMGVRAPRAALPASYGVWHRVEIEARGARFKAAIDGVLVQDLTLDEEPELRDRLRRGRIGFPDMGYGYALRRIEIEELGRPTRYEEFAGIEGWSRRGAGGEWQARGGTIEGANGDSILYAPPQYGDFEFSAVVRTHGRVNSGVFLRGDAEGARRGFEVQIYSPVDGVYQTGSIYGRRRSRLEAELEGRWFLLQIRVAGGRATAWVDGREVADFDGLPEELRRPGRIGLQIHSPEARVEFRDLRIRRL